MDVDALLDAIEDDDLHAAKSAICKHKVDVNATDDAGVSNLHFAASLGRSEIVAFLITQKANPNSVAVDDTTALLNAVQGGFDEVRAT